MTADDAVELCQLLKSTTTLPVHYEGWSHFKQGRNQIERAIATAPETVRAQIRWASLGDRIELDL